MEIQKEIMGERPLDRELERSLDRELEKQSDENALCEWYLNCRDEMLNSRV